MFASNPRIGAKGKSIYRSSVKGQEQILSDQRIVNLVNSVINGLGSVVSALLRDCVLLLLFVSSRPSAESQTARLDRLAMWVFEFRAREVTNATKLILRRLRPD